MADFAVIYDAGLELGCVIDTESMIAVGPVGAGPNARGELQAFVDAMPSQLFEMYSGSIQAAYMEYWQRNFSALYAAAVEDDAAAHVERDGAGDDAARLAEREAVAAAAEPPPPGPADTDMEADAGAPVSVDDVAEMTGEGANVAAPDPPPYEGECFACHGAGTVPGQTDGEMATCNLCNGTGRIVAQAAT